MSVWEAKKILHLLQQIGEQRDHCANVSEEKKLPGLEEATDELISRLFEDSAYWNPPSKTFEMMELEARKAKEPTVEQLITPSLSFTLMMKEESALKFWTARLASEYPDVKDNRISLDTLISVRERYIADRQEEWLLLQELLKIDLDEEHPFHQQAKSTVDKLMQKDLVTTLVTHVERLSLWRPKTFDSQRLASSLFPSLDVQRSFAHTHTHRWIAHYLDELADTLDSLLWLAYSPSRSLALSASQWVEILTALCASDFTHVQQTLALLENLLSSADALHIKTQMDRINLQIVLFVAASLSLWQLYTSVESSEEEGKRGGIVQTMDVEALKRTLVLFATRCGTYTQTAAHRRALVLLNDERERERELAREKEAREMQCVLVRSRTVHVMFFLFKLFVQHHRLEERLLSEESEGVCCDEIDAHEDEVVANTLSLAHNTLSQSSLLSSHHSHSSHNTHLARHTFSTQYILSNDVNASEGENDNESEGDRERERERVYCSVLQEIVQLLIRFRTLADPTQALDLRDITELLRLAFPAGEEVLFEGVLLALRSGSVSEREHHPLFALLRVLCEGTVHDPVYCVRMLSVLCSVESVQKEIVSMLEQPVRLISVERLSDVRFYSSLSHAHREIDEESESVCDTESECEDEHYERLRWLSVSDWRATHGYRMPVHVLLCRDAYTQSERDREREGVEEEKRFSAGVYSRSLALHRTSSEEEQGGDSVPRPRLSVCTPVVGSRGSLLDWDWQSGCCTVRWETVRCDWWALLADHLLSLPPATSLATSFSAYNAESEALCVGDSTRTLTLTHSSRHWHTSSGVGSSKRQTALVVRERCEESLREAHAREREEERELVRNVLHLHSLLLCVSPAHTQLFLFRMHSLFLRLQMLSVFRDARCEENFPLFWKFFSHLLLSTETDAEEMDSIARNEAMYAYFEEVRRARERSPLVSPLTLLCKEENLFSALATACVQTEREVHSLVTSFQRFKNTLSSTHTSTHTHYAECVAHHVVSLLCYDLAKAERLCNTAAMSVLEKSALHRAQSEAVREVERDLGLLHSLAAHDVELAHSIAHFLGKVFPLSATNDHQGRDLFNSAEKLLRRRRGADEEVVPRCGLWDSLSALSQSVQRLLSDSDLGYALQRETYALCGALYASLFTRTQPNYLLFLHRGSGGGGASTESEDTLRVVRERSEKLEHFLAAVLHYLGGELYALSLGTSSNTASNAALLRPALASVRALVCAIDHCLAVSLSATTQHTQTTLSPVLLRAIDALTPHTQSLEVLAQFAALLPALLATHDNTLTQHTAFSAIVTSTAHSMRELFSDAQKTPSKREYSSILPLDLSRLQSCCARAWSVLENVLRVSLDVSSACLSVLRRLLAMGVTRERLLSPLQKVCARPVALPLFIVPFIPDTQIQAPRSGVLGINAEGQSEDLGGVSYLSALFSLSFLNLEALQWSRTHALRHEARLLARDLVNSYDSASSPSLVDTLSRTYALALWRSLLDGLQRKAEGSREERRTLWELFCAFAQQHPDMLSFWLSTKSSCVECKQILLNALEDYSSADIDDLEPFSVVLSVMEAVLTHARTHQPIARLALFVCGETRVWSHLLAPLRDSTLCVNARITAAEEVRRLCDTLLSEEVCEELSHESVLRSALSLTQHTSSPSVQDILTHSVEGLFDDSPSSSVSSKALQAVRVCVLRETVTARCVRVLSLERHGLFFDIQQTSSEVNGKESTSSTAVRIAESVERVLSEELSVQHRLSGWLKHFLAVHDHPCVSTTYTSSLASSLALFGFDWQASLSSAYVRESMPSLLALGLRNSFVLPRSVRASVSAVKQLHNALWEWEAHSSIITSNLCLVRAWRDFLPLFISSPIAISCESSAKAGSLSPCVRSGESGATCDSPSAQRESAFGGDRRSYEVLSCTMSALTSSVVRDDKQGGAAPSENEVRTLLCACEQSALLVYATHHQLREVCVRASAPGRSVWRERERERERRLSPHRLRTLLRETTELYLALCPTPLPVNAHNALTQPLVDTQTHTTQEDFVLLSLDVALSRNTPHNVLTSHNTLAKLRLKIQQRLLTTLLLLLCALHERDEEDGDNVDFDVLCGGESESESCESALRVFSVAVSLLRAMLGEFGTHTLFSTHTQSPTETQFSHNVHAHEGVFTQSDCAALAQLCLQIALHALPTVTLSQLQTQTQTQTHKASHSTHTQQASAERRARACVVWSRHVSESGLCDWLLSLCAELHTLAHTTLSHTPLSAGERERLCEALTHTPTQQTDSPLSGEDHVVDISTLITVPSHVNGNVTAFSAEEVSVCVCSVYELLSKLLLINSHALAFTQTQAQRSSKSRFTHVLHKVDNPEDSLHYRCVVMLRESVVWSGLSEVIAQSEREVAACESALCGHALRLALCERHRHTLSIFRQALALCECAVRASCTVSPALARALYTPLCELRSVGASVLTYPLTALTEARTHAQQSASTQRSHTRTSAQRHTQSGFRISLTLLHCVSASLHWTHCVSVLCESEREFVRCVGEDLTQAVRAVLGAVSLLYSVSERELAQRVVVTNCEERAALSAENNDNITESVSDNVRPRHVIFGEDSVRSFARDETPARTPAFTPKHTRTPSPLSALTQHALTPRSILKTPRSVSVSGSGSARERAPSPLCETSSVWCVSASLSNLSATPLLYAVAHTLTDIATLCVRVLFLTLHTPFDDDRDTPAVCVGRSVFYVSPQTGLLCEGEILSVCERGSMTVRIVWASAALLSPTERERLLTQRGFTEESVLSLTECGVWPHHVRYSHRPQIAFSHTLPQAPTTQPADTTLTTAHLWALLTQLDREVRRVMRATHTTSTPAQPRLSPATSLLWQQLTHLLLSQLDHTSLAPTHSEIPHMVELCEDVQQCVRRYLKVCEESECEYAQWLTNWCERVVYRLQRAFGVEVYAHVLAETPVSLDQRTVKKSSKLREKRRFDYEQDDWVG